MNKETTLVKDFILNNSEYTSRVNDLLKKHRNIKDFQVMLGYLIMEILNTNKSLMNIRRDNIDLPLITIEYFGKEHNDLQERS